MAALAHRTCLDFYTQAQGSIPVTEWCTYFEKPKKIDVRGRKENERKIK